MKTLKLIKKVAPEINEILERRYLILRGIQQNQPIGRRTLATELGFKERTVRDEVAILKNQELLDVDFTGTYITEKGHKLLDDLHEIYNHLKGIPQLEEELRKLLKIKKVIIVPGNSSENRMVLKDMGKITFKELKNNISSKDIIGITGGNTMASVVEEAVYDKKERDILVIPARGGLGRNLNTQSNSIAAKLAEGLGGSYRLLYIPDALEEEALEYILKNEEISHSLNLINNMNTLVFGIGRADIMAK
ncbi:MAG TPA: sugar-binding domain-containing protein, partial [Tissierellaceae bacterium]|nr:sugar-binding domain-containing protein [Tissierellaceae bacterium]